MLIYRLGTPLHPVWDGSGAARWGGRWNDVDLPAIYAAATLSLAMLEYLVQRVRSKRTLLVEADVLAHLPVEDAFNAPPLGWSFGNGDAAKAFGSEWLRSRRTPILRVPSVVVPRECNYVVNPDHPLAASIVASDPEPLVWDDRLFAARQP